MCFFAVERRVCWLGEALSWSEGSMAEVDAIDAKLMGCEVRDSGPCNRDLTGRKNDFPASCEPSFGDG